jgi:hypothetical protein
MDVHEYRQQLGVRVTRALHEVTQTDGPDADAQHRLLAELDRRLRHAAWEESYGWAGTRVGYWFQKHNTWPWLTLKFLGLLGVMWSVIPLMEFQEWSGIPLFLLGSLVLVPIVARIKSLFQGMAAVGVCIVAVLVPMILPATWPWPIGSGILWYVSYMAYKYTWGAPQA